MDINNIKRYVTDHKFIDILVIIFIGIICTLLYSNHFSTILPDRGREFYLAQKIMEGAVPYKDTTLIYFPLSYYINALIFKLAGVSINALLISQAFLCIIYSILYYYLSKEFLERKTAFILTFLIIVSCIFSTSDLFSMITPYSYARVYGLFAITGCIYSLIKLFKTNNIMMLYIAAILAGLSMSCKFEYVSAIFIICFALFLYKKLSIKQYIKSFLLLSVFPVITLSLLFIQGVSIKNICDAIIYGIKFASTPVMTNFLSIAGTYPFDINSKLQDFTSTFPYLIMVIIICFCGLKLKLMYNNFQILILTSIIIWGTYYSYNIITYSWIIIPYILLGICIFKYKNIIANDKTIFFLIVTALLLSQREFFRLSLTFYGTYSFPLLILSFCVLIENSLPKKLLNIKIKDLLEFVLIIFIGFYIHNTVSSIRITAFPLKTNKGTIYLDNYTKEVLGETIDYISNNIDKNATVLVLPEGNFINFITDRNVDLKCFMLDRLYHDAYGEEKSRDLIANTNSDYIILIDGLFIGDFHKAYLYSDDATLSAKYIENNYHLVKLINRKYIPDQYIKILKRNTNK